MPNIDAAPLAKAIFLPVVIFLHQITSADANTVYSSEPESCQILGDGDIYGFGIRLSFYLQWVGGMISTAIDASEDVNRSRTAANIIIFAVLINCIRDASEGGLMSIEWIIVSYLVMVSNLGLLPWRWDMLYDGRSSLGWSLILLCVQWLVEPWLYFVGIDQGLKEGCELRVQNPVPYDIHDRNYTIAAQVGSVILVVISILTLWFAVSLLLWDIMATIERSIFSNDTIPRETLDSNLPYLLRIIRQFSEKYISSYFAITSKRLQYIWLISQLIIGPIAIACIEETLKINEIDLSAFPLDSTGQLIPLLAGAFSLIIAIISMLRDAVKTLGLFGLQLQQHSLSRPIDIENRIQNADITESGDNIALKSQSQHAGNILNVGLHRTDVAAKGENQSVARGKFGSIKTY